MSYQETSSSSSFETSTKMKKFVHRRMISLPGFDDILAKSKKLLSTTNEMSPIPSTPNDELEQMTLSSMNLISDGQRCKSLPSDAFNILNDDSTILPTVDEYQSNSTMVFVTSPSINSDLSSEQNDSIEQLNPSALSVLQTKQCRIDHRRNKSEPIQSSSAEDLSSTSILELSSNSFTTNDSSLNNRMINQTNKKSSTKHKSINISPSTIVKQKIQEKSSPSSSLSSSRKKKPWYNPFQSTYRQRNEEFQKSFKELPNEERLIVDYSCAWQKDILIQGRMYLSQNYLWFYSNILNWKTSLSLKFKDIVGITREKTAKVIPNAIEIKLNTGEKYFFASFVTRDKAYALIHRIWQNVQNDQPIDNQQLWTMIHESYGDDLDMTTDEEDMHHKPSPLDSPIDGPSSKQENQMIDKYDRIASSSIHTTLNQQDDDHSSVSSRGEQQTDNEGIYPTGDEDITDQILNKSQSTMEKNSENTKISYLNQCPCQSHLATELINRTYPISVERLFDYIFGDNDFLVAYRASRRIKDFHATEWQINAETGKRERLCTYKVTVAAVIGSTTICSNEKQIIDCELANSYYIIDTEVRNEGIKYADSFFVASRYCLVQIGPNKSHLKVTGEVRYVKSLMAIIKTFIEKNATAALQDSFTDLMKRMDQESSRRSRTSNNNVNDKEKIISTALTPKTRSLRQEQFNDLSSSTNDLEENLKQEQLIEQQINLSTSDSLLPPRNTIILPICVITMLLLLIVNIFLCIKLNQIDHMTDRLVQNYPTWLNKYSFEKDDNQWSSLLKSQEEYYQIQLSNLQTVLTTTHNVLKNVTFALNQMSKLSTSSR